MLRFVALACLLALSTNVSADQASAQSLQNSLSGASAKALAQKADDIKLKDDLKLDINKAIKEEEKEIVMQQAALKWIDSHPDDVNHFFKDLETEHPDLFIVSDASASDDSEFEAQQFGFGGPFGFGGFGGPFGFGGFGGYGGWGRGGWGRGGWGRGFGRW